MRSLLFVRDGMPKAEASAVVKDVCVGSIGTMSDAGSAVLGRLIEERPVVGLHVSSDFGGLPAVAVPEKSKTER